MRHTCVVPPASGENQGTATMKGNSRCARGRKTPEPPSPADPELFSQGPKPLRTLLSEILQETAALADEHQQAPPGVVILHMQLEVIGQAVDALRQERDLDLRRAGVPFVESKLLDEALLRFDCDRHSEPPSGAQPPIARPRGPRPERG